ncbi:MAG TPA: FCD domain-containing protein [Ilumatobacter sp.]|nr:FCD domain-containing protein [Ilumatobacter sp.]
MADNDWLSDFKLPRETLADRVTDQLRQQILSGRLPAGELVPTEKDLREAFGVGRTTVREALHGLVVSGFLERRSNQLYVRDRSVISDQELDYAAISARVSVSDVFEARKAIESCAIEMAARNWTGDDIGVLRVRLEALRDRRGAEYHAADIAFHTEIFRIAKNPVLLEVYENSHGLFFKLPSFWRLFGASSASGAADAPIAGWEGHRHIVDAIEARDAVGAAAKNAEMLDRVAVTLIERVDRVRHADDVNPLVTGSD